MARILKIHQPLYLGSKGQANTLGLDDQQNRQVERFRYIPCTRHRGHSLPVVKAHCALADGRAMPGGIVGVQLPYREARREEQVEVVAVHMECRTVEHRVDVVRPTFEGARVVSALFECRQHRAGDGGLSAARTGRGDEKLNHFRSPVMRKIGLFAISRWSFPAGFVRLTAS